MGQKPTENRKVSFDETHDRKSILLGSKLEVTQFLIFQQRRRTESKKSYNYRIQTFVVTVYAWFKWLRKTITQLPILYRHKTIRLQDFLRYFETDKWSHFIISTILCSTYLYNSIKKQLWISMFCNCKWYAKSRKLSQMQYPKQYCFNNWKRLSFSTRSTYVTYSMTAEDNLNNKIELEHNWINPLQFNWMRQ